MIHLPETSVGHGESGRASAFLGVDDLVTAELHACSFGQHIFLLFLIVLLTVHKSIQFVAGDVDGRLCLAEERHDRLAGVSADDGDGQLLRVLLASDGSDEGLRADHIESGDTKELLGVEDVGLLQDLGSDGDSRVDGVGDDENVRLGAVLCDALDETFDDASVDLEKIITAHARLA